MGWRVSVLYSCDGKALEGWQHSCASRKIAMLLLQIPTDYLIPANFIRHNAKKGGRHLQSLFL